jgi:hypothetical protein
MQPKKAAHTVAAGLILALGVPAAQSVMMISWSQETRTTSWSMRSSPSSSAS